MFLFVGYCRIYYLEYYILFYFNEKIGSFFEEKKLVFEIYDLAKKGLDLLLGYLGFNFNWLIISFVFFNYI